MTASSTQVYKKYLGKKKDTTNCPRCSEHLHEISNLIEKSQNWKRQERRTGAWKIVQRKHSRPEDTETAKIWG